MANITIHKRDYIDLDDMEFPDADSADITTGKKKIVLFFSEGNSFTIEGNGFKYGADGIPTAGKMRKIIVEENGRDFMKMSGLDVPVTDFVDAMYDGSDAAMTGLLQKMLRKADSFSGGNRGDTFFGFNGRDKLDGNGGADYLDGGKGKDEISGGKGKDKLFGGAGNDRIDGGKGKDVISGDGGADILKGGKGADTFLYRDLSDSTPGAKGRDTIRDFKPGQDVIDLSAIDIDPGTVSHEGFGFIGDARFSGEAGELRFETKKNNTFVYGDADGDGRADLVIKLKGALDLDADDFVL